MKKMKNFFSIFSVTLIFTLVLIIFGFSFSVMERLFPSETLTLKKDLLYIGSSKTLSLCSPKTSSDTVSLDELLGDERVTFSNTLALISSVHPIKDTLDFSSICEYKSSDVFFDISAHGDYSNLSEYISKTFDKKLYVMSAYRTAEEQNELFIEQGADTAQKPGESEHQSGLALDVYISEYAGATFLKSDVGKYINTHCHQYGFIIRYPDDKKDITGIDFEPWHIRYVGYPHAKIISLNNITLEEYLGMLENDKFYSFENYIIFKTANTNAITLPETFSSLTISPDNCGNYVFTFNVGNN